MERPEMGAPTSSSETTPACYAASSRRQEIASMKIICGPLRRFSDPKEQAIPDGRWGLLTSQWDATRKSSQTLGSRSGPRPCDTESRTP